MNADKARTLLTEERERVSSALEGVEADVESQRESTHELSFMDQHPADVATETFEREKDMSIQDSLEHQVDEIDAALERVDEGTYGKCQQCGRDIGDERLVAVPATRFCLEHQAEQDRR